MYDEFAERENFDVPAALAGSATVPEPVNAARSAALVRVVEPLLVTFRSATVMPERPE